MKLRIAKEFKWDMSHRLQFHKGLCKNIHGHTYRMRVEIVGETDTNGMVLDYYDLAEVMEPIVSSMDHSFICDEKDNLMLDFLKVNEFRYLVIPYTTTAENITRFIIEEIEPKFRKYANLETLKVRFHETEDVFAEMEVKLK